MPDLPSATFPFPALLRTRGLKGCTALAVMLILAACFATGSHATDISVCVDQDSPPTAYWARDAQGNKTDVLTGSSIELFRTVFARMGLNVTYLASMPWVRCMKTVEVGSVNFAIDAYIDKDRQQLFVFSIPYQTFTPQVFFDANRPVSVTSKADLKKYKGCGMLGWSYEHYGLNPADLDLGVNEYKQLFAKLKAGRCDYFVEELEAIAGFKLLGFNYLDDPEIKHGALTDVEGARLFLIAGKHSSSARLVPEIDRVLQGMLASGEVARIIAKYQP